MNDNALIHIGPKYRHGKHAANIINKVEY